MFEVRHVRVRRVALALLLLRMRFAALCWFVGGYAIVCTYRTSPYGKMTK